MSHTKIPPISRIDQSVRDSDFINITELKEFNTKFDQFSKLLSLENVETGAQASDIGNKLRAIEYNMADAVVFDSNGKIVGYRESEMYEDTPIEGENSIDNLVEQYQSVYGEFLEIVEKNGVHNSHLEELQQIFEAGVLNLKQRLAAIVKTYIDNIIAEAQTDESTNYVTQPPVSMDGVEQQLVNGGEEVNKASLTLNPDISTVIRTIVVTVSEIDQEVVLFEVDAAVVDNIALNMKIHNDKVYQSFNVIVRDKQFIVTRDESVVAKQQDFEIKVYKYKPVNMPVRYVFVLRHRSPGSSEYVCEIEGVFVKNYYFANSGNETHNVIDYSTFIATNDVVPISGKYYYERDLVLVGEQIEEFVRRIQYVLEVEYIETYDENANLVDSGFYKNGIKISTPDPTLEYYVITSVSPNQYEYQVFTNLLTFDPAHERYFLKREINEVIITDDGNYLDTGNMIEHKGLTYFESGKEYFEKIFELKPFGVLYLNDDKSTVYDPNVKVGDTERMVKNITDVKTDEADIVNKKALKSVSVKLFPTVPNGVYGEGEDYYRDIYKYDATPKTTGSSNVLHTIL